MTEIVIVIVIVTGIETEIVIVITTVETEAETGEDGEVVMMMMTAIAVHLGTVVEQQSHLPQLLWRSQVYKIPQCQPSDHTSCYEKLCHNAIINARVFSKIL